MRKAKKIRKPRSPKEAYELAIQCNLKALRLEKGLSQSDIAKIAGVTRSIVSLWERNKRGMRDDYKLLLCEALGCSITTLFDWRS